MKERIKSKWKSENKNKNNYFTELNILTKEIKKEMRILKWQIIKKNVTALMMINIWTVIITVILLVMMAAEILRQERSNDDDHKSRSNNNNDSRNHDNNPSNDNKIWK